MYSQKLVAWLLAVVFTIFFTVAVPLRAGEAEDKATDIAQMKRVWEALMACKKARGALPDKLADLVPEFLPDPKLLISPVDDGEKVNGPLTVKEGKHPSSYGYEWGPQPFYESTFTKLKTCQVEEYGEVVPLLRCFLHGAVLNISHAGDFYETETNWELAPVVKEIMEKRGLGPGCKNGRFLELITTDPAGKPLADVKVTVANRYVQNIWLPKRTLTTGPDGKARIPFGPDPRMAGTLTFEARDGFAFEQGPPEAGFEDKLTVAVQPAQTGGGIVKNAAGLPVEGAKVRVYRIKPQDPALAPKVPGAPGVDGVAGLGHIFNGDLIAALETDAGGRWEAKTIPANASYEIAVAVSHPLYRFTKQSLGKELSADAVSRGSAEMVLRDLFVIRGQLLDRKGVPLAGASVLCAGAYDPVIGYPQLPNPEAETDAEGRFELRCRVGGESLVIAVASNQPPLIDKFLIADETQPLALTPPVGRKLSGRVVDNTGRPVDGIPILFAGWPSQYARKQPVIATTDADGRWTWEQAPPDQVIGQALLPSGRLWFWREEKGNAVETKIPAAERE